MGKERRQIEEILKRVTTRTGEELAAVRCSDGTFGISNSGVLIAGLEWKLHNFEDCLNFLERFALTSPPQTKNDGKNVQFGS